MSMEKNVTLHFLFLFLFLPYDCLLHHIEDYAIFMRPYANPALYQIDVPALSYIYAAYGKSGLISNGKE